MGVLTSSLENPKRRSCCVFFITVLCECTCGSKGSQWCEGPCLPGSKGSTPNGIFLQHYSLTCTLIASAFLKISFHHTLLLLLFDCFFPYHLLLLGDIIRVLPNFSPWLFVFTLLLTSTIICKEMTSKGTSWAWQLFVKYLLLDITGIPQNGTSKIDYIMLPNMPFTFCELCI